MGFRNRSDSDVFGRKFIVALGGLFVVLVVSYPFLPTVDDASSKLWVVLGILVGIPGLVLLYGGYRLPQTDIRSELYPTIGKWCLRGIVIGLAITFPIVLVSDDPNVVGNILLLTALGSLAGFGAGRYDARAKTRELDLQETIDQLETSNERLEQFAYAASHDLQEPLRMVSSYLRLIENRADEELTEETEEFLEFAVDGADRMRGMINGLLAYSRVETQGEALEPVDLNEVVEDVRDDLEVRITESDADVDIEELPRVAGDEHQLRQVFQNVLSNAIEYSGNEPPRVHISATRNGSMWEVSVRDEGIGIEPDEQDRIFEVFQRLQSRNDHGGSGIGLALCERIVERHGGEIRVDSKPGEGATFSFTLPAEDEHDG
ncbi:ATP-binding protein [Natrinema sp. DC36]|uniref:ATP-binding protein n=1 Tax=Natrinema sp. DC36 TaxID=2878680 RepID=UPI001CF08252|nr:ATP-binding protein [Natrinema sp. DC36]